MRSIVQARIRQQACAPPDRCLHPAVAPSLVTMRPKAPHDPAIKLVEEPADVGLAIVPASAANDRVDLVDQLLRTDRSLATGALTNLVLEVPNGFCTRKRIARSPVYPASDLRRPQAMQPQRPLALFDLVAEKLKPVSDVPRPTRPPLSAPGLWCRVGIRVFSVCRVTPSLASIRLADSSAARASPRLRHVSSRRVAECRSQTP